MVRLGCLKKGSRKKGASQACQHGEQQDAKGMIPRTSVSAPDTQPGSTVGWDSRQCPTWSAVGCLPRLGGNITSSLVVNLPEQLRCSGHSLGNGDPKISERIGLNQSTGRLSGGLGCSCWLSEPSLTSFANGWACVQQLLAAAGACTHTKTFTTLYLVFKMELLFSWVTAIQLVTMAQQGMLTGQHGQPMVWDLFSWKLL